jgi:hypothetical protein
MRNSLATQISAHEEEENTGRRETEFLHHHKFVPYYMKWIVLQLIILVFACLNVLPFVFNSTTCKSQHR